MRGSQRPVGPATVPSSQAIAGLRRPTTGAWLANLVAHERPQQVGELLGLSAAMQRAQAELAAADLRRLSARRHRLIGALLAEACHLATEQATDVSEHQLADLEA